MRVVLSVVVLLATPAGAEPMWNTADRWQCTLNRHLRVPLAEATIAMDPAGRSYEIDFAADTVTSAFVPDAAKISERRYYPSVYSNHNVVVARWGDEDYPFVILEEQGNYWEISGSGAGDSDGEAWIAMYECLPQS